MKKIYILFLLSVFVVIFSYAQNDNEVLIGGVTYKVDTLSAMKVGPGSFYTALKYSNGSKHIRAFLLEIDAQNQYIKFESVLGKDSLVTCELTSGMAKRKSRERAVYFAGTNADFFATTGSVGYPIHGCVMENQIGRTPANSPHMAFSGNIPVLDNLVFEGSTCKIGENVLNINDMNTARGENQLILYNTLNGNYTHTNNSGTEVLIELSEDTDWNVNTTLKAKVIAKIQNKGNMHMSPGQAVLSGHGSAAEFLNKANENEEIELYLGIRFISLDKKIKVDAAVGGDRMILHNGVITDNDWAELHPRTAIGYSEDGNKVYFCVVDGRSSVSAGVRTKELGDIIKSAGAFQAMNLDGGGSSAMYIKELGIMNRPSDGNERAVCNGIYAVNTAPEDDQITEIRSTNYSINLPRYGMYTPVFYGYNQYGTLINTDLKGVKLSCEKEMGTIEGNTFIASGTEGGKLTAEYNGAKTTMKVNLTSDITPVLKQENVLTDNNPYLIEVQAMAGETLVPLLPDALDWTVDDSAICSINKGVLTGLTNGVTNVHGKFGEIEVTLKVTVEIPSEKTMPIDKLIDFSNWEIKSSSNISNISLSSAKLPLDINYTYSSGRAPYIQLLKECPLYSLPTSLKIILNTGNAVVSSAIAGIKANNTMTYTPWQYVNIPVGEDYVIDLKMEEVLADASDRASYPVYINGLKLMLDNSKHPTGNTKVTIKEFSMNYGNLVVGINQLELISRIHVYPNPVKNGEAYLSLDCDATHSLRMELYTMSGTLVRVSDLGNQSGQVKLPLEGLQPAIYFMKILDGNKQYSVKIIVK